MKTSTSTDQTNEARVIIDFLNARSGKHFRPTDVNLKFAIARLKEGYTLQDCKTVIAKKVREWKGTDMEKYIRPATLLNCEKFNNYAGAILDE